MAGRILVGDVRQRLRDLEPDSIHCVVTSPPYLGLRTYHTAPQVWGGDTACSHVWGEPIRRTGGAGKQGATSQRKGRANAPAQQLHRILGAFCTLCGAWQGEHGREPYIGLWVTHEVEIWREIRRVLRRDGVAFLNIGDAYANDGKWGGLTSGKHADHLDEANLTRVGREKRSTGLPPKSRMLLPERLIIGLQDDGWVVRDQVVWSKLNPMPSSVTDRTTPSHELVYLLSKRSWYFWDGLAIAEPASIESEARYHRERSDSHKWADGGPGGQTIARSLAHMRSPVPSGWDQENKRHDIPGQYRGRAAGNKRHKFTEEFSASVDPDDRPKARLLEIAHTAYGLRNKRSVWPIATEGFAEAHFATFPTALVEPCILAATSHRGACPDCGAGFRRVERVSYAASPTKGTKNGSKSTSTIHQEGGSAGYDVRLEKETQTLGWYPACRCAGLQELPRPPRVARKKGETDGRWLKRREAALRKWEKVVRPQLERAGYLSTIPCTVLDPFLGSGTTALVADRLGRDSVGIELNREFAEMAERRCAAENALFAPRIED